MIRRSTLIAVEILLGLVAALAIGLGIAWWRLAQGPLELSSIRQNVEAELSAARDGRPVAIDRVELAWNAERNTLELRALGVAVQDAEGAVLSRADEARIELDVLPLLIGRVSLKRADFFGGAVTITRKTDGAVHIAFGPPGAAADIVIAPPPPNETLEARVARVLDGMEATFRPVGAGGGLQGLSLHDARLAIIDEGGGGSWTADAAHIDLRRQRRALSLRAQARLEGAQGQAPAQLRIDTDTQFQSAVIEFAAEDVRPRALFSPAALGAFAGLDAPVTAAISVGLDRRRGVSHFDGEIELGPGSADTPAGRLSLEGGRFHGRYDIESDELIIDALDLAGDRTRIDGEVRVRNVSAILNATPNQPAAFDISLPALRLAVPGTFAAPVSFANVRAVGTIASSEREVRLTQFSAQTGAATLTGAGRLYWAQVGDDPKLRPGIELDARVAGTIEAPAVMRMWPIGLAEGARDYLARSLTAGQVSDGVVRLDIRPADIAAGVLRDEAMDIRFNVTGGEMRFIETMSPVTGGRGSAVLRGNRFDMIIPQARLNGMQISNGVVEIPRLKPKGAMATITARVEGDARNVMQVLLQAPLALGDRLPIDTQSVQGRAALTLRIQRPMLSEAPFEVWRFNVEGAIRDFAGAMSGRQVALSQGQLGVRGNQDAITISGPIRAGGSALSEVRWTERIGVRTGASSEYQIAGDFDANDLERLGYPVARFAQGRLGVTVSGEGRGFDVENARIDLDLEHAAVETPWAFWTKRAGQPASASFSVERQRDGGLLFNNIDARGAGLFAQGRVRLGADDAIVDVNLPRLVIEGRSNARVTATRAADGGLDVSVAGALFDAAPFMDGPDASAGPAQANAARENAPPLRARIAVERLLMRSGAALSDARVELVTHRGALARLTADGRAPGGGAFSLALGEPQGRLRFRSEDAGFAVAALTGSDNVVGGVATADGSWRTGPPSHARFSVDMRNFEVVRLPAMARLLSSAGSLTGLVEMLNGDGIGFSRLDAQMVYANERLTFTEGRMTGPSLGLTGAGGYNLERDDLDIDGVVAPSPRLNLSMLGEIPVLGNLIVSRRGEGVFGMTYSINGPAGSPRVGVNPVSALTPGILRRIFEPLPDRQAPAPEPTGGGAAATQTEARNDAGGAAQSAPAAPP